MHAHPDPKTNTSSHPLVTIALCIAVLATLIGAGSYVSKQRSMARDASDPLTPAATVFSVAR